jgi:hypothetical protein
MSDKIIYVLITFNVALISVCLFEKNYHKALYWFGAFIINSSILWGMR